MKKEFTTLFITFFAGMFIGMAIVGQVTDQIHQKFDPANWSNVEVAQIDSETEQIFGSYIEYIISHEIDWEKRMISVLIDPSILRGSDAECEYFGQMMKHITSHDFVVYILNTGWIPTLKNPIDYEHASLLAKGY